jgi:hypothetical protein
VIVRTALRVAPPNAPLMVAVVEAVTDPVVMVKVALVAPDATVTLAGTVATAVLLLVSVTTAPPDGAALVSLTVPCDAVPPTTLVGLAASDDNDAGGGGADTVKTALRAAPPNAPLMVAGVEAVTDTVVTVKVALVAPDATMTFAGTLATAGLLLVSVTAAPPDGAALVSLTVPFDAVPPTTLVGLTASDDNDAGGGGAVTVNTAVRLAPPDVPPMVTDVDEVTDAVLTVKVALVAPAATVTLAGTVAALELAESDTDAPPAGAAALNVTVPVEELPPATLVGLSESAESVATGGGAGGLIVSVALCVTV